ncbi:MAG: hypothetical protein QOE97_2057 [Pseudonocardiales bacterium]|nr:hypothetical protein [Pseudonocardiales bacterium]
MRLRNLISATMCCSVLLSGCASQVPPDEFFGNGVAARVQAVGSGGAGASGGAASGRSGAPASGGAGISGGSGASNTDTTTGGANGGGPAPGAAAPASPVGAVSGVRAGSCAGFRNSRGITDSTITLGNVADLSGPVPGLFTSAAQAAKAYAAYFNATSNVCGRKLKLIGYDSQTSGIGDQEAATSACSETFAMVGSIGAFDNGGAKTVADCGIPDLRTISTTPERVASPVSYGADAVKADLVSTSQYEYIKAATGQAYQKSALVYLNAGASVANALAYKATMQALGYDFVYTQPIDVTAINYAPYAAKMKSLGVGLVQFEGTAQFAVRLKRALNDQGLNPVFVMDSVAYDPVFVESAKNDLDGMYTYVDTTLVEEASRNPAMQRYLTWLARVAPGAKPSFFGMFAWGAMELFSELAVQLGGKLTRQTLLAAIRNTHAFTAGGLFAPQDVGTKNTSPCQAVVQLRGGVWVRRSPFPWTCSRVYDTQP